MQQLLPSKRQRVEVRSSSDFTGDVSCSFNGFNSDTSNTPIQREAILQLTGAREVRRNESEIDKIGDNKRSFDCAPSRLQQVSPEVKNT